MKHVNIPIFVPHAGCPHDCVFCNQKKITGKQCLDISHAKDEIEQALSTVDCENSFVEIAFFGGSFTGIPEGDILSLLEISDGFVESGRVRSVRCSTRPDYIDSNILDILEAHHVKTIEIGVQSVSDRVLRASARGHTAEQTERACELIVSRGFELVGQMMLGLPESAPEDEIATARAICRWGAKSARIYPTVVFYDTALFDLAQKGEYQPLTPESAAKRCASVIDVFVKNRVDIIRLGLCESEGLHTDGVYSGAYHPALGELCFGEYYYLRITEKLKELGVTADSSLRITVTVDPSSLSKAVGQSKINKERLTKAFPGCIFVFGTSPDLAKYGIGIKTEDHHKST